MSLFDIINSVDLTLEKNIKSYNNSFVDKFINELKYHIAITESLEKLDKVPKSTLFTLDRYEGDFAVCENRTTGEMYDIPSFKIDSSVKEGEIIKLENSIYKLDYKENEKQREISKKLTQKIFKSK